MLEHRVVHQLLLTYYDAEQTAFSIINQYVRFVDEEADKRKNDWKLNDRWAWFIGDNRQSLKLTTKPEPYTLDRTLRWVQRQVGIIVFHTFPVNDKLGIFFF